MYIDHRSGKHPVTPGTGICIEFQRFIVYSSPLVCQHKKEGPKFLQELWAFRSFTF